VNINIFKFLLISKVDSMLLDKGENILYLSHKIPEMDDLTQVFVEIWNAVHAPDVAMSDESAQAKVYSHIELRLAEGEIAIPKCLDSYVRRHLLAWTRNAFRAKNLVTTKDSYKVDDLGDGRGQQIVIMDKETGMEQAQMHWSQGLHQFLQLKHTLKLSPVSLKAVFMSNIGFFKQHEGAALYGMTGTLGSTAECQLLHDVFNVDFFKMPRFKRRFCLEEDPLLASSKGKWLTNINKATNTQLHKGRAVLIICENIASAEAIYNKLLQSDDRNKTSKIVKYVSSLDTEFQKKQNVSALCPGDVIVATNLAGRGTDLKINKELVENGGLHVVIAYMPPNARVEAQIEGRVARAGQPGSFQFVLCHSSVNSKEDSISELLRLKVKRDDEECRRLETIRNRGLEKIYLEEKLFDRFHQEIYNKMKNELADSPDCEMQMKFLTNRWALWLDENAVHINYVHLKKTGEVEKNFQNFKKECLTLRHLPLAFAVTPSELMLLGDFYETSPKVKTDISKSRSCYDKVIKDEPKFCGGALIRNAKLVLQVATSKQKKEAKVLLKRAKTLIKQKMELLTATSQLVKLTSQANQKAGGAVPSQDRFEEQILNQLSLLQIHLTAVEDILGRPVRQALGMHFQKEEEFRELLNVIEARADLCKPYRLSKKISVNDGNEIIWEKSNESVKWPSWGNHCQTLIIQLIKEKIEHKSYTIKKNKLCDRLQKGLNEQLKIEEFAKQKKMIYQQIICITDLQMDEESIKNFLNDLPEELLDYKSLLVYWLQRKNGECYATAVGTLGLKPKPSSVLEKFLKTKKILLNVDKRHRNLLKASRKDLTCQNDEMEVVDQLWNYLIEQGVIKESKIVFPRGPGSEYKVEEQISQIKKTISTTLSSQIDDIFRKHNSAAKKPPHVSYGTKITMALIKSIGQLKTIPTVTASFQPLSKYFMFDPNTKRFPAEEIQSFQDKTFDRVITLAASWDFGDWRNFFVAKFTVAVISAGIAAIALSGRNLSHLVGSLTPEIVRDMMLIIQNCLSCTYTSAGHVTHQLWSNGMTIVTAGLSCLKVKKDKAAISSVQDKTSSFIVEAKQALVKYEQAIWSYLTSMTVVNYLTWLKTFIIKTITVQLKGLISKTLFPLYETLLKKLEQIRALMKIKGRKIHEAIKLIESDLDKSSNSDLSTLWGRSIVGKAASLTSFIGGCFAESGDVWETNDKELFKVHDAEGLDSKKTSFKFDDYTKKAVTCFNSRKNGAEVLGLVNYTPKYVNNVNETLDATITKLEDEIEIAEENKKSLAIQVESETESNTFDEFKKKVTEQIEEKVSTYVVESVKTAWAQPSLQSKIEGMVEHCEKKTLQSIGSMWQGSEITKTSSTSADQENKENQQTESAGKANAAKLEDSLGEDGYEIQKDRKGNLVIEPKTYEEVVDSIGSGKTAGFLAMQMIADALKWKLEIVDTVGDFVKDGSGSFTIDPEGKATGTIQVKYTANEDGTKHVTFMGPEGKDIDLPPTNDANGKPNPPNRCLYDAVAKAKGCSTAQLLNQVKAHAIGNKMARYLYEEKVGKSKVDKNRKSWDYENDNRSSASHADLATINKENISGGSDSTKNVLEKMKENFRKIDISEENIRNYQAGLLIGFSDGGSAGKLEK
jgi:hypothetical protein